MVSQGKEAGGGGRRRRGRKDSRQHRILKMRKGDVFEFRGLRIKVTRGTGKLEFDVLTPQPFRHTYKPVRDLTPHKDVS